MLSETESTKEKEKEKEKEEKPTPLCRIYKSKFEAAHYIKDHPKCGKKHGHSYSLIVYLNGLNTKWKDFSEIKQQVDDHVQKTYDHEDLGNKSAEEIAMEIGDYLSLWVGTGHLELMETEKFGVSLDF